MTKNIKKRFIKRDRSQAQDAVASNDSQMLTAAETTESPPVNEESAKQRLLSKCQQKWDKLIEPTERFYILGYN